MQYTGFVVVDLDYCRDRSTGELDSFAKTIVENLNSYTEVSPSGEGVKIWLRGKLPEGDWQAARNDIGLEIYASDKYLCVTGDVLQGYETLRDVNSELDLLLTQYMETSHAGIMPKDRPADIDAELEIVKSALEYIDATCSRNVWVTIGQAIHWLSKDAFDVWHDWSAKGDNYAGYEDCQRVWHSLGKNPNKQPATIGTLYFLAKKEGFVKPSKKYSLSEYGMACRIADRQDGRLLYIIEDKKFFLWDGRTFKEDPRGLQSLIVDEAANVLRSADNVTDDKETKAIRQYAASFEANCKIEAVKRLLQDKLATPIAEFDAEPYVIHCQNGVIDLSGPTVQFLPHHHCRKALKIAGAAYIEGAVCPRWGQFLNEVLGDEDLIHYVQQIVGLALTNDTRDQSIYILHGDGENGKSVFTETIVRLLGDYAGVITPDLLAEGKPHDKATLFGLRLAAAQETDDGMKLKESTVKQITDGRINACKKFGHPFTFDITHKTLLATNKRPKIIGTEHGIWRRIKPIPFEKIIPEEQKDATLKDKLTKELPGILNWAIQGFYAIGGKSKVPKPPKKVADKLAQYRDDMDLIGNFIKQECVRSRRGRVHRTRLFERYKNYCRDGKHFQLGQNAFYEEMRKRHGKEVKSSGYPCFKGLDFRDALEVTPDKEQSTPVF